MNDDRTLGVFLHCIFPLPGFNQRDMGFSGWKGLIDHFRAMEYNACALSLFPQLREPDADWTLPEARRLYHSLIRTRPLFQAGDIYDRSDPVLATPAVERRQVVRQQVVEYAADAGLAPHLFLPVALGSPSLARERPDLLAPHAGDFCNEGYVFAHDNPEAVDHLLQFWARVVDNYPRVKGFILWHADPGVGDAGKITENPEPFADFLRDFAAMLRTKRPDAVITLPGWGLDDSIVEFMSNALPPDLVITEPPLIHSRARSADMHTRRIRLWQKAGRRVQQWLEVQENPTVMLPACYPRRIDETIRLAREEGVTDLWSASSFYTYVFTPHFRLAAERFKDPGKDLQEILDASFRDALGDECLNDARAWTEAMESLWTNFYTDELSEAGFNWPFHMVYPGGLFPQALMREPIPQGVRDSIEATVLAAENAWAAAQRMAEATTINHPLETNVILVSTELLLLRARFRQAKIPVLEAIRRGDLKGASEVFGELSNLAQLLTETAACAPNTHVLNTHWTKLSLLPEKLDTIRRHLPELVEAKSIRGAYAL